MPGGRIPEGAPGGRRREEGNFMVSVSSQRTRAVHGIPSSWTVLGVAWVRSFALALHMRSTGDQALILNADERIGLGRRRWSASACAGQSYPPGREGDHGKPPRLPVQGDPPG